MAQRNTNERRRVVITGMGAITPLGPDMDRTWQALIDGRSGVRPITRFDATPYAWRIAATVDEFEPGQFMDSKEARRLSRFIQFALAAAVQAVDDAKLDMATEDPDRVGVEIGSALGGTQIIEEQKMVLETRGQRYCNPVVVPVALINSAACSVAIRMGIHGPVSAPVAACATGPTAIGEAARRLAYGETDVMLAGGSDSVITALGILGFGRLGALSTKNDTPERACAPFSADRDGTVIGEGAGVVVMEALEHARGRGARILAEVTGYGFTCDAHHLVAPEPTGRGAAAAITKALDEAGTPPDAVDLICAHGTGTQLNDAAETLAIKRALGEAAYRIPVSSNKGALGHMLGAAGAISTLVGVKALQTGVISPTINYSRRDPECDLDYVPNHARTRKVNVALVNAFGFGGQNAVLVLRAWRG